MDTAKKEFIKKQFLVGVGAIIFVLPYNLLITPMHLYSGNFTGIAQILRTLLVDYAHVALPRGFDITGIILFLINIPLLTLAFLKLGKFFFVKTVITTALISLFFSLIPVPPEPIISDPLTACLIGGVVAGFGAGMILREGSSGGGLDILGMYFAQKRPNFSVGKVVVIVAIFVFTTCLFLYDFEVVVYSAIFTYTSSFALDRFHYQTVKVSAFIVTSNPEVAQVITQDLSRGGTEWTGQGVYSHTKMHVYMTVLSKYEVNKLRRKVHALDPHSFIAFQTVSAIEGYFQPHL